jgi:hypothetical protein
MLNQNNPARVNFVKNDQKKNRKKIICTDNSPGVVAYVCSGIVSARRRGDLSYGS